MTTTRAPQVGVTRWDVAAKRAPIVLAAVGAASLVITPPVALYRDLKADLGGLSEQVEKNTVGIARLEERMDNVEAGLQEVKDGLTRLEGKVDQVLFILAGKDVAQP